MHEVPSRIIIPKIGSNPAGMFYGDVSKMESKFETTILENFNLDIVPLPYQYACRLRISWLEDNVVRRLEYEFNEYHVNSLGLKGIAYELAYQAAREYSSSQVESWMYHSLRHILDKMNSSSAWTGHYYYNSTPVSDSNIDKIEAAAWTLPGVKQKAQFPCPCARPPDRVGRIIMHLNDRHQWPREKIADWLDEVSDREGIDLTFKVVVEDNKNPCADII